MWWESQKQEQHSSKDGDQAFRFQPIPNLVPSPPAPDQKATLPRVLLEPHFPPRVDREKHRTPATKQSDPNLLPATSFPAQQCALSRYPEKGPAICSCPDESQRSLSFLFKFQTPVPAERARLGLSLKCKEY